MVTHNWVTATALAALVMVAFAPTSAAAEADPRIEGARLMSAMEGDAHRVASLLRNARAARAPEPIKCVDRYLSQIDAGVRHGRDDLADVRSAVATGDVPAARRALGWLASRREAARTASFAADACVGPATETPDHTVVRVVVDPKVPSDRAVFAR